MLPNTDDLERFIKLVGGNLLGMISTHVGDPISKEIASSKKKAD